jgi:hypothetical protein
MTDDHDDPLQSGSVIKAIKEEAPYLQPIRFNRIKWASLHSGF